MKPAFAATATLLGCALVTPAFAQSGTWTLSGTGNWSTPGNWSGSTVADGASNTATFTVAGTNLIHLDTAKTIGNLNFNTSGTYTIDNNGTPANILTLSGGTPTITIAASSLATISATIAGTSGLTKANLGGSSSILSLSGSNTYSGTTTISGGNAGFIQVNSDFSLGTSTLFINSQNGGIRYGAGSIALPNISFGSSGGRIDTNGFNETITSSFSGSIAGGSFITKVGTGTLTLAGSNSVTGAGGVSVSGGAIKIDSDARLGGGTGGLTLNGGTIVYGAAFNDLRAITLGNADGTIDTNGFNVTYSQSLTGAVGQNLTKAGLGTLTMAGTQTYSGTTIVNAGTLLVNGSHTATAVAVNANATLGGTGTIGGATTIANNATLAPGTSPGLLTFSNNLTFAGTDAKANFEIGTGIRGTNYDAVNVSGALAYNGDLTLTMTGLIADGTYNLFDFTSQSGSFDTIAFGGVGNPYSGSFVNNSGVWTATSGGQTFTFTQSTGDLVVAVPEPSTLALLFGGSALLLGLRRRRRIS